MSEQEHEARTWCPMCGPGVVVFDDGCCVTCGSTAVGDGADAAHKAHCDAAPSQDPYAEGRAVGYAQGRASLLESTWEPAELWAASPRDDFDPHALAETREEAISEAMDYADHGDVIYVTKARWRDPAKHVVEARKVADDMRESLAEGMGEDAAAVGYHALAELSDMLASWARRHVGQAFWDDIGKTETVDPGWCQGGCEDLVEWCKCEAKP